MATGTHSLIQHIKAVKKGQRRFENAFQSVSRMIFEGGIEKIMVNGKTTYDFKMFRTGPKHVIGMYDEINSFVSYVKDAAEGGSSKEMAFVLVGEPGNGKTFFVEFLAGRYRSFLAREENRKYHLQVQRPGPARHLRPDQHHRIPDLRRPHDPGHEPLRDCRTTTRPS